MQCPFLLLLFSPTSLAPAATPPPFSFRAVIQGECLLPPPPQPRRCWFYRSRSLILISALPRSRSPAATPHARARSLLWIRAELCARAKCNGVLGWERCSTWRSEAQIGEMPRRPWIKYALLGIRASANYSTNCTLCPYTLVKGCVSVVSVHATFDHVYLDNRVYYRLPLKALAVASLRRIFPFLARKIVCRAEQFAN